MTLRFLVLVCVAVILSAATPLRAEDVKYVSPVGKVSTSMYVCTAPEHVEELLRRKALTGKTGLPQSPPEECGLARIGILVQAHYFQAYESVDAHADILQVLVLFEFAPGHYIVTDVLYSFHNMRPKISATTPREAA